MNFLRHLFTAKQKKPHVRFFCLVPGVNTLYPVVRSNKLDRQWVSIEKEEYEKRKSKCPFGAFKDTDNGISIELVNSIGKCPAIHSIMGSGFIIKAPADISVSTNGDGNSLSFQYKNLVPHIPYVVKHEEEVSKWLLDSSKDNTVNQVIKINTPWRIICNSDDIVFLVTKVPFNQESRFTPVIGILDPKTAYEINIQLFWHVMNGDSIIKAGTPLVNYIPVSRSLLNNLSFTSDDANENDYDAERAMTYSYDHVFSNLNTLKERVNRVSKILKRYYG